MADLKHVALRYDVHRGLKQAAFDRDVPIQELATQAAKEWLERNSNIKLEEKVPQPA